MTQQVAPNVGQPTKSTERLIWAGSRALSGPESRYPPILKEATAISHALTKLHIYLKFSKPFFLFTDHSPLANLHAGSLETAPERLLPLLEHWRGYPVTIKYIPGRSGGKIQCADFLSRPPPEPSHEDYSSGDSHHSPGSAFTSTEQLLQTARSIDESFKEAVTLDPLMQDVLMEAKEDTDYKLVCTALHEGKTIEQVKAFPSSCLLYTSPSPRDMRRSRMPSSA